MPHVTAETLAEALPQVMAAPRERSRVDSLCFRPATNRRDFPDRLGLTRTEGIPGDRWRTEPWLTTADGAPDPEIQISLLPLRVLDLVWQDRDSVVHPGDTIIADLDMSTANLPEGTRLQVGGAVLRVSGIWNDGCAKWKVRYGRAAYDWVKAHPELRLRGILCAVETDGEVAVGDEIRVLR